MVWAGLGFTCWFGRCSPTDSAGCRKKAEFSMGCRAGKCRSKRKSTIQEEFFFSLASQPCGKKQGNWEYWQATILNSTILFSRFAPAWPMIDHNRSNGKYIGWFWLPVKEQGRPWKLRFCKVFEQAYPFMLHSHGQIGLIPHPGRWCWNLRKASATALRRWLVPSLVAGEILSIGCISSPYGPIWGFLGSCPCSWNVDSRYKCHHEICCHH